MTVTIDGQAGANFTNASSGAISLSTTNAGDAIVVVIQWGAVTARPADSVASISSTNTTGWTRRLAINTGTAGDTLGGGSGITYMEVWYGLAAAALSSESITVNMTGGLHVDSGAIAGFGVSSTVSAYSGSPFDTNGSCPSTEVQASGTSSAATPGPITTNATSGLSFTGFGLITTNTYEQLPSGYTQISSQQNPGSGVTWWANIIDGYESFSSAVSGYSVTYAPTGPTFGHYVAFLDALVDATTAPDSGTWASTESPDIMSFTGHMIDYGTWASTDSHDTMSFGEYPNGTWHSTDPRDMMGASGYLVPPLSGPGAIGPFYFAWVDADQTTFDPSTMLQMDEAIFSFEIKHDEGQICKCDMSIKNPREGLLNPGRKVWAWLSYQKRNGTVVPLFFGVLVGIPTNLFGELIAIQLNARPQDYIEQRQAVAEKMKIAPYYDAVWLDEAHRDEPDSILEGWSSLFHTDRVTLDVTASDILEGEDGTLVFDEGMGLYNSVNMVLGECPLNTVQIQAQVKWTQRCIGFVAGPSANIMSYTGGSFKADWPKPGAALGGGWRVEYSFVNDCYDTEHARTFSVSSNWTNNNPSAGDCSTQSMSYSATSTPWPGKFIQGVGSTESQTGICDPWAYASFSDGSPLGVNIPAKITATGSTALLWQLNCSWFLRYDAKREFSEFLVMNVNANVQGTLTSPLVSQNTELIKISGADVGLPVTTPEAWSNFVGQPVGIAQLIFPNDPTKPGGTSYQICVQAGVASTSEPTFSDIPGTITPDNTVLWASLGEQPPETQPEWTNSTPVALGEIFVIEPKVFNLKTQQMETTGASFFFLCTTPGTTNGSYTSFDYLPPITSTDDLPPLPVPFAVILGPGDSAFSNTGGGGSGGFIGNIGSTIQDGSVVWTNLGTSPAFLGIPIGGTMTNVTARNFFSTDRGQLSIQYLLAKARARLRYRSRCVTVSWDVPFELGLTLSCRQNATLYDPRIPGGVATGKIKSYTLSADKTGKLLAHIEIGCSAGFANSVPEITGTPEYTAASGYMQPGYQAYDGGQYSPFEEDLGYTRPNFAPFDDGLGFPLQFFPGTITILHPDQNPSLTEQMAAQSSPQLGNPPYQASTGGPPGQPSVNGGLFPGSSIYDWLHGGAGTYAIECDPVAAEILIQPVVNGPFNGAYFVKTTMLELPNGINLEAMSSP